MGALMSARPDVLSDEARAEVLALALGGLADTVTLVQHPGQPIPKARARRAPSGRFYTPNATQAAEEALAWRLRRSRIRFDGNVAVACIFFRKNLTVVDGDNLLKLVLDAATTAGLWRDDCQVTGQAAVLELDRRAPRTVIAVAEHESTLARHLVRVK